MKNSTSHNQQLYTKCDKKLKLQQKIDLLKNKISRVISLADGLILKTTHYVHQDIRLFKIQRALEKQLKRAENQYYRKVI